ncbi:hypothetical protein [Oceanobacillus halophilus]|uniref:LPXTG cell wall anchor domain-containing protein n=1 Tax=Oceanobacillus halophilus TaxID=930130 RepID=A0A494ZT56_9BACI|nr:hypothetical protein [Oceanobacillus halophilus]RKQ29266.1 hypothetical protein D8M06_17965 [Oceanobacillus halophilus]
MKDFNYSFISGLTAFLLIIAPFGIFMTVAEGSDEESVREDVYDDPVREEVYGPDSVREDVYGPGPEEEKDEDGTEPEEDSVPEDVDSAVISDGEESVTGDVYYDYSFNEGNIEPYINNGNIVVNNMHTALFPANLLLSRDMSSNLVFHQSNAQFTVHLNGMEGFLVNGHDIQFYLRVFSSDFMENSLTPLYLFDILDKTNGKYLDQSSGPITITFQINPNDVENWDNIVLRYLDMDEEWVNYPSQNLTFNKQTGEVNAVVSYLGAFVLSEITEEPNDSSEKDTDTDDPSVVDDVYTIWDPGVIDGLTDKNGNIHINNASGLILFSDVLKVLDNDRYIMLRKDGVLLSIPINALKEIANGQLTQLEMIDYTNGYPDALSKVFHFNLLLNLEEYEKDFPYPFEITFTVDPDQVKSWDDLVLRQIDANGKITDSKKQILHIDRETGKIVVEVYHFSTFGIFEIEGSGDPETKASAESDKKTTTNDEKTDAKSDSESDSKSDSKTKSKETEDKTDKSSTSKNISQFGEKLPDTATNMFTFIGIGLILLLTGFLLWIWTRKSA